MIAPTYGVAVAISVAMVAAALAIGSRVRVLGRLEAWRAMPRRRPAPDPKRLATPAGLLAGGFIGSVMAGPVGASLGAVSAWAAVRSVRRKEALRRREREETQLSELADALAAATRAGRSLRGALAEAGSEIEDPLRGRIAAALGRLETGEPLARSLLELSGPSGDASLLVTVLPIHERTGGRLPTLLDDISSTIVRRVEARRQARALTAQARASGAVLAVLPIAFVGLLSGMGGGGLGDFYRTAEGAAMLTAGAGLDYVGFLWMRRLARIGEEGAPA